MTLKFHISTQTLLVALQGFNWSALPQRMQWVGALAVSVVQLAVAVRQQFWNPDGQPATVAYRPKGSIEQ